MADGDAALDDVALHASNLFELIQKVQTSIEAASRNAREKRRVIVFGGYRIFERVAALDLQAERREPPLNQLFDQDVLSDNRELCGTSLTQIPVVGIQRSDFLYSQ